MINYHGMTGDAAVQAIVDHLLASRDAARLRASSKVYRDGGRYAEWCGGTAATFEYAAGVLSRALVAPTVLEEP